MDPSKESAFFGLATLPLVVDNPKGTNTKIQTLEATSAFGTTLFALLPHDVRSYLCRSPRFFKAFEKEFHIPLRDFDISLIAPAPDTKTAPIGLPRFVYLRKPGADGNFTEPLPWNESPYYSKFIDTQNEYVRKLRSYIDCHSIGFIPGAKLSRNVCYLFFFHVGFDGHPLPVIECQELNYMLTNEDGSLNEDFKDGTIPADAIISPNTEPKFFMNFSALYDHIAKAEQKIKTENPDRYIPDEMRGPANFFGSIRLYKPLDAEKTSWHSTSSSKTDTCTLGNYHKKFGDWASTNRLTLAHAVEHASYYSLSAEELEEIDAKGFLENNGCSADSDSDSDLDSDSEESAPRTALIPIVTTVHKPKKPATPRATKSPRSFATAKNRTALVFLGKSGRSNIPEELRAEADVDPDYDQGDDDASDVPPVSIAEPEPMELETLEREAEEEVVAMIAPSPVPTSNPKKRSRPVDLEAVDVDEASSPSPKKKRRLNKSTTTPTTTARFVNMPVRSEPGPQAIVVIGSSSDEEDEAETSPEFRQSAQEATEPVVVTSPVMYQMDQTPLISHSLNARPIAADQQINPDEQSATLADVMDYIKRLETRIAQQEKDTLALRINHRALEKSVASVNDAAIEIKQALQTNTVEQIQVGLQQLTTSVEKLNTELTEANNVLQERVDHFEDVVEELKTAVDEFPEPIQPPASIDIDKALALLETKIRSHLDQLGLNQNALSAAQHQVKADAETMRQNADEVAAMHRRIKNDVAPWASMAQDYGKRLIKLEQELQVLFNLTVPVPGVGATAMSMTPDSMHTYMPASDSPIPMYQ